MGRSRRLSYDPYNDYYVALGISAFATPDEIQSAFRQRAKVLHPDRNQDEAAKEKFQSLSEAYDVLSDPDLRVYYNALRQEAQRGTGRSSRNRRSSTRSGYGRKVLGGLFSGPYRYIFVVIALVALANMVFIVATRSSPLDSHLPTETLSEPVVVPQPLDPAPVCDPGASITSPANNATLTSAFDIFGSANGAYQVDWSPLNLDESGRPQLAWSPLVTGKMAVTRGILVARTLTAALPTPGRLYLRLTVTPADGQPFQICEIALRLESPQPTMTVTLP